jgi:hypothetical protein
VSGLLASIKADLASAGLEVRDVLDWTKGPFFFRNELLAFDGLDQQRPAGAHEIKRLGDHPIVTRRRIGRATL